VDRLRALWDFADPDASEQRFRALLESDASADDRAEILTQLARVAGLRGHFGAGDLLVDEAEALRPASAAARSRIRLERGRLRRSGGDPAAAFPLFESAYEIARTGGEHFLAADAAHMAALVDPEGMRTWTERGIELAEREPDASYWLGPLLNNLGWELHEAGEHERALDAFQRALHAREQDPENKAAIEIARYAVAKALRALGRPAEAAALLEQAVAWAEGEGNPDGWFHEELAESYAELGRPTDAAAQARRALAILPGGDPSFEPNGERAARLRRLTETTDADRDAESA
jgi:tetratricopeptide (TPR) repeat protein